SRMRRRWARCSPSGPRSCPSRPVGSCGWSARPWHLPPDGRRVLPPCKAACGAPIVGDLNRIPAMDLLDAALRARANAYAPYSGFRVGAAVRCPDGSVHAGCNVENVAYPEGTCAEAGAIAAMVASGRTEIAEVLVVADGPQIISPCG